MGGDLHENKKCSPHFIGRIWDCPSKTFSRRTTARTNPAVYSGKSVVINAVYRDPDKCAFTIDWGDGTLAEIILKPALDNKGRWTAHEYSFAHTYSEELDYKIKLKGKRLGNFLFGWKEGCSFAKVGISDDLPNNVLLVNLRQLKNKREGAKVNRLRQRLVRYSDLELCQLTTKANRKIEPMQLTLEQKEKQKRNIDCIALLTAQRKIEQRREADNEKTRLAKTGFNAEIEYWNKLRRGDLYYVQFFDANSGRVNRDLMTLLEYFRPGGYCLLCVLETPQNFLDKQESRDGVRRAKALFAEVNSLEKRGVQFGKSGDVIWASVPPEWELEIVGSCVMRPQGAPDHKGPVCLGFHKFPTRKTVFIYFIFDNWHQVTPFQKHSKQYPYPQDLLTFRGKVTHISYRLNSLVDEGTYIRIATESIYNRQDMVNQEAEISWQMITNKNWIRKR